jgi:hypothetical protein
MGKYKTTFEIKPDTSYIVEDDAKKKNVCMMMMTFRSQRRLCAGKEKKQVQYMNDARGTTLL